MLFLREREDLALPRYFLHEPTSLFGRAEFLLLAVEYGSKLLLVLLIHAFTSCFGTLKLVLNNPVFLSHLFAPLILL